MTIIDRIRYKIYLIKKHIFDRESMCSKCYWYENHGNFCCRNRNLKPRIFCEWRYR